MSAMTLRSYLNTCSWVITEHFASGFNEKLWLFLDMLLQLLEQEGLQHTRGPESDENWGNVQGNRSLGEIVSTIGCFSDNPCVDMIYGDDIPLPDFQRLSWKPCIRFAHNPRVYLLKRETISSVCDKPLTVCRYPARLRINEETSHWCSAFMSLRFKRS